MAVAVWHLNFRPQLVSQLNLELNAEALLAAPSRFELALINQDARNPIVIAKKCQFTTLIVH